MSEPFCIDCPDREACATGWPCWKVKEIAEHARPTVELDFARCRLCRGDGEFGEGDCPRCCGNGQEPA